jgi:hypothetical protein
MQSNFYKNISIIIFVISSISFVYLIYKDLDIVQKTRVTTHEGIYSSYISTSKQITSIAKQLTNQCHDDKLCQVQSLLDFVSNIPYRTQTFQQKKPLQVIKDNFGDCDDKSNLLISLLHSLGFEAYFVLVPQHIFVIVYIEDTRLKNTKGLWINGKKYYILESTAKGSKVGFPLHYKLKQIDTIVEPFSNQTIDINQIRYAY